MISLGDPRTSNPVLSSLQIKLEDKIISVKENANADSNFILTHLIKQIFYEKNKLCLVTLHNLLDHYQNVGKKLGYDLRKAVNSGEVKIIEPLSEIVENIGCEENYLQENKENIVKGLFLRIKTNIDELLANNDKTTYLIIDDVSHLLDLGLEISLIVNFVNYCINLADERISVVLNTHVSTKSDEIISNTLKYVANVHIEILPLKTGRSNDVTGIMYVERENSKNQYQYKAFDRGIKTFHPGESIYHLYK